MRKYPCTPDCEKRNPGCHDRCKEYLDAKAENDRINQERKRQRAEQEYHMKTALDNRYKGIKKKMNK